MVKTLNTVTAALMVDPLRLDGGAHDAFVAGDDDGAKSAVVGILREFGWLPERIRDLGGLDAARGMEMWLPLWLRIFMRQPQGKLFNIAVVSE